MRVVLVLYLQSTSMLVLTRSLKRNHTIQYVSLQMELFSIYILNSMKNITALIYRRSNFSPCGRNSQFDTLCAARGALFWGL